MLNGKNKWVLALGAIAALMLITVGYRAMTRPELDHFEPSEFGPWWLLMNRNLLLMIDEFRERWGAPVSVSPAQGAIGREDDSHSQHNVNKWGEVRAIDLMPSGMNTAADRQRAYSIALDIGFTGIGIYPDWQPKPGIHLDVRDPETPGHVATWAGLKDNNGEQYYAAIEQGIG
jgi:hypothetical protein